MALNRRHLRHAMFMSRLQLGAAPIHKQFRPQLINNMVLGVCATLTLLLSQAGSLQAQSTSDDNVKSPVEIAKIIAAQGKLMSLDKSKLEVKIEKRDPVYRFREGESRAVLVKLPEYTKPYVLKVFSAGSGFMTIHAFAPITVVLNSEFMELDQNKVAFASRIGNKRKVFVTQFRVDDAWRNAKYLFFYTNGSAVGQEAARDVGGTTTVQGGPYTVSNLPVLDVVFRRGPTGRLKFEVANYEGNSIR